MDTLLCGFLLEMLVYSGCSMFVVMIIVSRLVRGYSAVRVLKEGNNVLDLGGIYFGFFVASRILEGVGGLGFLVC